MADQVKWDKSHNVEDRGSGYEKCIRCGYIAFAAPFPGIAEEKCAGPSPLQGRGGRIWINPNYMDEFMALREVRALRFWNKKWCDCEYPASVGYELARYKYSGYSCMACDRVGFTSKEHCHCAICGGISQVG